MSRRTAGAILGTVIVLCAMMLPVASGAAPKSGDEQFSALAYLPSGPGAGGTAPVTIRIEGYTTDDEARRLHGLLLDNGPDAVLKALSKMKTIGNIATNGRVSSYNFKVARSFPTPTGRHIIAIADRPIGFLEAYYNTRSEDYRFGVLELDLKSGEKKEEGEGSLIYAAKVKVNDDGQIEIENFGIDPVRLLKVKAL